MHLRKPVRGKAIGLLAVIIVIVVAWYWYAAAARSATRDSVRSVPVTRGTIEEVVTAQGKLEPKQYVDVGTQVSGQLRKIHVDIGDTVKAGQLLAEIDPRVYQAQVEANEARIQSLQAQLDQQKAELNLAEENLKRNRSLMAMDAISRQALEESESQAAVAEARVQAIAAQIRETESNLQGSRTNLSFTRIYAPIAGTVTSMTAREGQTLNANQSAPIILQVADLDTMTVRAQAAEADISRLTEGMEVYFTTLGNNERRWQSKVRQILPSPQIANDVVLYDVLIDIKNDGRQLMSGMTTQVFFIVGKAEDATMIPAEALTRRVQNRDNHSGRAYQVAVATESGSEQRIIHVGLQTRAQAEVTDGLEPGEIILLNRPTGPTAGQANAARGSNTARFTRGPQL